MKSSSTRTEGMPDQSQFYSVDRVQRSLSTELMKRLLALAQRQGVTLFVTLLSGWVMLLRRSNGREVIVVGIRVLRHWNEDIDPMHNAATRRVRLSDDVTVEKLLKKVRIIVEEASALQDVPSAQLAELLETACSQSPSFRVLRRPRDTSGAFMSSIELQFPGLKISEASSKDGETRLELSVSLSHKEESLTSTPARCSDLCERIDIERMAARWEMLLEGMVTDAQQPISQLPMLTAAEREQVLYRFNDTAGNPKDRLIHDMFEQQVQITPDAVALIYEQQSLTYTELNNRANQLARYLRNKNVGSEELVGIYVERSIEMVVGLLGVLKAGAAYAPLDPAYPSNRLAHMLKAAAPRVLLTQEKLQEQLQAQLRSTLLSMAVQVIALDSGWSEIAKQEKTNLDPDSLRLTSRHLAYVIFTSGSTGEPKGVAAEHRGTVNRIAAQETIGTFSSDDICCQKTSIGFVDAIFEILGPLSYGKPLVLASAAAAKDVELLASLIEREHITRLVTVPSLAQSLLESVQSKRSLQSLRSWTLSGEELKEELLKRLYARLPKCTFINLYGSSEVAADVTCYVSKDFHEGRVPLGRPIANTQIYILDSHLQPVPIGVAGEIYVGGKGVARGYLNRPELTATRFIADPFGQGPEARLYRSGDLGLWRADGTIEYIGRNDHQVKIRGYRIELTEIEAQLVRHVKVKEAVVLAREDVQGEKRLVAYITQHDQSGPSVEELRAHLKTVLPEYMVPSAFVVLETLPLTPTGKLDRQTLPVPEFEAGVSREYEAPQGDVEESLARIWRELLRVERVGRHDNFFELGGHSLLIVRVLERLRRIGISLPVRSVYEKPTLSALASAMSREAVDELEVPPNLILRESEVITPEMLTLVELGLTQIETIVQSVPGGAANIQDIYPLAPLQEGMLFHHLLNEQGGDVYVGMTLLSLSSRERLAEFIQALQAMVDRHDVLRTAVLWEKLPRPVQVVYREATLPVEAIALDLQRDPIEQIREWRTPERQRFDLRQAPLMRLQVAADTRSIQWYALLQMHHLVCDNESQEILLSEVMAYLEGSGRALPMSVPYRNHVAHALAYARTHDADAFFREKLKEIDEPTAPFGLLDVHGDGSQREEVSRTVEPALARRIRVQGQRLGVSAAALFHAGWALVVSRTSGRNDVAFGTVLLGRLHGTAGGQRTLGMFINTLPLRLRLHNVTATALVEETQRELMELLTHEQASLAVAQRCSGIAGSAPLFSTLLNYLHGTPHLDSENPTTASGIRVLSRQEWTNYPIVLSVENRGDGFVLTVQTDPRIDPYRMVEYVSTAMGSLVEALEHAPQTPALALSVLSDSERHQVIHVFNAMQAPYPQEMLLHELFEDQVRRTSDAIAIECREQSLTYAELNRRANQLARYLRRQGVGLDQMVAICLDRSVEMVVGMLGILKAGGAYIPLDANSPIERWEYMLRDSAPAVLLTQQRLKEGLPLIETRVIALDADWDEMVGREPDGNLDTVQLGLRTQHLAYVIYTSGSTGTPKGVMVAHRSVVNLVHWHCATFNVSEGNRCSSVAAVGFDAAAWEIWPPLSVGGTLVLAPPEVTGDVNALLTWWANQPLDISFLPTPVAELAFSSNVRNGRVRTLLVGGDRLRYCTASESCSLINNYGPTESTVVATSGCINDEGAVLHIGRPIANTQIYILDRDRQPVAIGVAGEIYIGGAGVARGYLNRPELTAERFVADGFIGEPQARMYRSGDVGRWRMDGTIEYLGRNDHQVKIRGFRIELGEIEAQLLRHLQVKQAVVVAREDDPGDKRLVAYVTLHDQSGSDIEVFRAHLKAALPEYMIPSAFAILENLPLTPNGKVDRNALPVSQISGKRRREYTAPRTDLERTLAEIWTQVLRVEQVGVQDNFFELGGHSLLATRVIAHISHALDVDLPLRVMFQEPTIEGLSNSIVQEIAADVSMEAP